MVGAVGRLRCGPMPLWPLAANNQCMSPLLDGEAHRTSMDPNYLVLRYSFGAVYTKSLSKTGRCRDALGVCP